jgi:hypothetical protein
MTIIVHNSKTGSSKKYAEILSERTGLKCYSVRESYPNNEDIIFFGWLRGPKVMGLSKIDPNMVKVVCIVGLDNEIPFPMEKLIAPDKYDVKTFYLRGWLIPEKINFLERFILKIVTKKILKEKGESADRILMDAMIHGGSFFDESFVDPIVEHVESNQ